MSDNDFTQTGTPLYSQFIHLSRYSRWLEKEKRRETWDETVTRYIDFFIRRFPELKEEIQECKKYIKNFKVMPSMRALMAAGPALEKDEVAGYNCSYVAIDHPRAFDEILYILTCGTGVGFSVERQFVSKLPEVAEEFYETETVIHVRDSRIGWAKAFRELISLLYAGQIPQWDLTKIRPAGARLKTFGGRASGPDPLNQLFLFTIDLFKRASGRKLNSIECHDLVCKIADVVICGGVRRSALISLSNPSDDRMRLAKSGQWWIDNSQRALSNNSACYTEKPSFEVFLKEWNSLYESKSGERGFFSRTACEKQIKRNGRREVVEGVGCNPCSEIILRSAQFCNLSEVILRPEDDLETISEKVKVATIFGTLQSSLTNFRYIRNIWKKNCEEERLLGVSLTGIMDHPVLGDPAADNHEKLAEWLTQLKEVAIKTNKEWSQKLGVNQSTAITCVKPSGNVSQLTNTSSGIHPRYSKYYIRTVRADSKDPLAQFMKERSFPCEQDVMNSNNLVFSFPVKSPNSKYYANTVGALNQLTLWNLYQIHWCEHKPSCTVYYTDDEFLEVGSFLWNHFDEISGVSFLPYSDHVYQQAPYQPVSEEKWKEFCEKMPEEIDWNDLKSFEKEDTTKSSHTMACTGGVCEIVDLTEE